MQFVSSSYKQVVNTIRIKIIQKIGMHNSYQIRIINSYRNQTIRIQVSSLVRLYELNRITPFTHTIEFVSIRIKAIR